MKDFWAVLAGLRRGSRRRGLYGAEEEEDRPWYSFLPPGAEREAAGARSVYDPATAGARAGERVRSGRGILGVRPDAGPSPRILGSDRRKPMMPAQSHAVESSTRESYQTSAGRTPGLFQHRGVYYGEESLGKPMGLWVPLTATEVEARRGLHEGEEKKRRRKAKKSRETDLAGETRI